MKRKARVVKTVRLGDVDDARIQRLQARYPGLTHGEAIRKALELAAGAAEDEALSVAS